ncbi:amidase [Variovorax sp. ZT5P49]|uniref:amidase n=1 Tax=Variovorax sp. ZT5P49 TaxID=3443733 RepID=UPI003F471808
MNTPETTYMTATELAGALVARKVSAVELAQDAIARIEQCDVQLNAICVRDFDRALDAAREADAARARGEVRPLLGIPITIKESFNIAGLPTTWGMPPFKDFKPAEDAVAVARLKAAGAVVLGKTNVPFALGDVQSYNEIYGTTNNPWDLARTPGGSSGGSSAALAAGYGPLSLGSDIGGSLRAPAHYCGVYAHKPSFGLLPSRGQIPPPLPALPNDRDLAVIGPMARSAGDLALMLDLLAEPDPQTLGIAYRVALPKPRHEELTSFRVLVLDTHPLMPSDSSIRTMIDKFANQLSKAGAKVARESTLLPDLADVGRLYMRLLLSTLAANWPTPMYEEARGRAAALAADDVSLAAERTRGMVLSHRDWLAANGARVQLRRRWQVLFESFDVVVCPVMPTPAFRHDQSPDQDARRIQVDGRSLDYTDQLVYSGTATVPGLPATAAPIGLSEGGLPIGVQIIGPMFEDRTTIHFAELVAREFGGFVPPPALCG